MKLWIFNSFFISIFIVNAEAAKLTTSSFWKIQASDGQTFSIQTVQHENSKTESFALEFSRGERAIKKLPILESRFLIWRKEISYLAEVGHTNKNCQHPNQIVIQLKKSQEKYKSFCAQNFSQSDLKRYNKLLTEMNEYLFGD